MDGDTEHPTKKMSSDAMRAQGLTSEISNSPASPRTYGYLRVSRETQDIDSQKLGLLEYARRFGLAPLELVEEVISRDTGWKDRALGALLHRTRRGDVILTPEFTRLAASPGQVFTFIEEAARRGVLLHITKTGTVMDGSIQSQLLASAFSMASMIELSFIRERTREGLRRARLEGKRLGRPPGALGTLKLAGREQEVAGLVAAGLSVRAASKRLGVAPNTLRKFLIRLSSDK
ncbi:recombinase family protein [Achromobacter spanius]|uniref:recombinase family protein n=1 Tax=Achromobacter spanius TaxID=217203 RepID=UPI00380C6214